jgi:LacI family transcriptional regulator
VPGTIRIVGYDDSVAATSTVPPLTSVRVPFERIGEALARLVLDRFENPGAEPRRETMATELIVRGSS